MSASTGIVLAATGISFTNEWINTGTPNFRVGVAGLAVALVLDGVDKVSPQGATGLALIMLATVFLTPFGGKSPAQTFSQLAIAKPATTAPTVTTPVTTT